jgi:uncharacterized membrane protein
MIKMSLKLYIICTATVLSLMGSLMGLAIADNIATVHGSVYKLDTYEPLDNAVIEVNSTPTQYMIAKNGHYSIELMPGNYTITARYYEDNTLTYATVGTITINAEGEYVYDLLLPQVNPEDINESSKKSITDTSIDKINNSNGVSSIKRSLGSVAGKQKTANVPVISNFINNLQTLAAKQSRPYSSIDYLLIGFASCFLFVGTFIFLGRHKRIGNSNSKERKDGHIIRNSFERVNILKTLVKPASKDVGSEVKQEFKENNEESVSVTEVESKTQERNVPGLENYPARKTELTESVLEEDKIRNFLEELAHNLESENPTLKKKILLTADLQEVVDIIKGQGGMVSQKDLRSKLNCSEVKVSVMLTDLEKMKRIKKFKRGRENFVVLIDWKR